MSEPEPKVIAGYRTRLHNRRVIVQLLDNGYYFVQYKKLRDDGTIKTTEYTISEEAMLATIQSVSCIAEAVGAVGCITQKLKETK